MVQYKLNILVRTINRKINATGKSLGEVLAMYPKLTSSDIEEIKSAFSDK